MSATAIITSLEDCSYLLHILNTQTRIKYFPLLHNARNAKCMVDPPEFLQGQLEQRDMILVLRNIGRDEFDSIAVVFSGNFLAGSGIEVAEYDLCASFDEEVDGRCSDAIGAA